MWFSPLLRRSCIVGCENSPRKEITMWERRLELSWNNPCAKWSFTQPSTLKVQVLSYYILWLSKRKKKTRVCKRFADRLKGWWFVGWLIGWLVLPSLRRLFPQSSVCHTVVFPSSPVLRYSWNVLRERSLAVFVTPWCFQSLNCGSTTRMFPMIEVWHCLCLTVANDLSVRCFTLPPSSVANEIVYTYHASSSSTGELIAYSFAWNLQ